MSLPGIRIKRNIYVKGFTKFPYQMLTGKNLMYYTGDIIFVDSEPLEYDHKQDWYFDCDCEFHEWGKLVKIDKQSKKQTK